MRSDSGRRDEPHTAVQSASDVTATTHAGFFRRLRPNITCFPFTRIVVMCGAIELANFLVMAAAWRTASLQFSQIKDQLLSGVRAEFVRVTDETYQEWKWKCLIKTIEKTKT